MNKTKEIIAKARQIMEERDTSPAMTIGFDLPTYELTGEEMLIIAGALYLADCAIPESTQPYTT